MESENKKMILKSMTDFVLEQNNILKTYENHLRRPLFERIVRYANFLQKPLNLGMFVPCDEHGNVLQETNGNDCFSNADMDEFLKFEKAKERVLFKGFVAKFEPVYDYAVNNSGKYADSNTCSLMTVEDILSWNLELTESAKKLLW